MPLYSGLKTRLTEKIAKGHRITLLKHTPCEVVGWELHSADRRRDDCGERLLQYLPLVIYVRFENAT